jgi:hypothetical protein
LSNGDARSGPPEVQTQPPRNGDAEESPATPLGTLKTLAFVLTIQIFALLITHVNAPVVAVTGPTYAPAGQSSGGSVINVLILVVFVFATTLTAVWLARKRRVKIFMAMVFVGTAVAIFLLTLLASIDVTSSYVDAYTSLYLSLAFATATVVLLSLITLRWIPAWTALILTGLLSAEVGSYFASSIPILTALLLPLAFSFYDIYTVFRGPLKTLIMTLPAETMTTMSSKIGDFSIGTGDTVFYAMLPALGYYQFGFSSAFAAIIAVDAGVVITLYLLGRAKLLPGLPIPMGLGLAVLVAFYVH